MSKARALLGVCLFLTACGEKKDEAPRSKPSKREPIVREEEMKDSEVKKPDVAVDDIDTPKPDDAIDPNGNGAPGAIGRITPTKPDPNVKPECVDEGPVISFDPAKLRACFDTNDDGEADRCVTWRRDGKVQTIDTQFAVEDATAVEEKPEPVEFRSDTDNNDDERITLDYNAVDVCPFDRTCMKIMPKMGDGEIAHVLTDPDYKRGVMVIRDSDDDGNSKGIYEFWDLAAGRLRTRVTMKRLLADETYDFSGHLGSGVLIALADDSNGHALGTIFSATDGGFRGELAQGSRNLDSALTFSHIGVFGIVDVGPMDQDKPYILHLHSLATGGALGKFTIKKDENAAELQFHKIKNGFVGVTQWGTEQVRIDMIDLRSRTNRIFFAPSC